MPQHSGEYVTLRPARLEDAESLNQLHIDRAPDMFVGNPEALREELDASREQGVEIWRSEIGAALRDPSISMVHVAELGEAVVGFCCAEARPNDPVTMWCGLVVARECEGQGVARRLEEVRQKWALKVGRPVWVAPAIDNHRSVNFFQRQGFEPAYSIRNSSRPVSVLILPYNKLRRRHG